MEEAQVELVLERQSNCRPNVISPLPFGRGAGVRADDGMVGVGVQLPPQQERPTRRPHPNPLPKGRGDSWMADGGYDDKLLHYSSIESWTAIELGTVQRRTSALQ